MSSVFTRQRRSVTRDALPEERWIEPLLCTLMCADMPIIDLSLCASRPASASCRCCRKVRAGLDRHQHFVHAMRPRDLDFVVRRQSRAIQYQLLDLRRKHVHAADDQHVIGPARDLFAKRRIAWAGPRQQACQVPGPVTHHGHSLLGERSEHQLARLPLRGTTAPVVGIDDLGQEMILPNRRALRGLGEFLRHARTHDLRQAVYVACIDAKSALRSRCGSPSPQGSAPKMPMRSGA